MKRGVSAHQFARCSALAAPAGAVGVHGTVEVETGALTFGAE